MKILVEYENFDEALSLMDQASLEGHQLDVLMYNTILKKASEKVSFHSLSPSLGTYRLTSSANACYWKK